MVVPVRPPFSLARPALWARVSLMAVAPFVGGVLWLALGFILWRNCGTVCVEYGHGPMAGNVGWNRESLMLWAVGFACFLAAL